MSIQLAKKPRLERTCHPTRASRSDTKSACPTESRRRAERPRNRNRSRSRAASPRRRRATSTRARAARPTGSVRAKSRESRDGAPSRLFPRSLGARSPGARRREARRHQSRRISARLRETAAIATETLSVASRRSGAVSPGTRLPRILDGVLSRRLLPAPLTEPLPPTRLRADVSARPSSSASPPSFLCRRRFRFRLSFDATTSPFIVARTRVQ
jgi:hypothetical protein